MPLNRKQLLSRQSADLLQMDADGETSRGKVLDACTASMTTVAAWFGGKRFLNLLHLTWLAHNAPPVALRLTRLAFEGTTLCVVQQACGKPATLGEGLEQSLDIVSGTAELAREYSRGTADRRIDVDEASRLLGLIDKLIARLTNLRTLVGTATGQPPDTRMRLHG